MIVLKQSTASQEVPLGQFVDETDGKTAETALTIANTDIKIWKTGATTLANKNSGGATHISGGIYYAVLDATDTDTLGPLKIFVHVSGALPITLECQVLAANVYDSLVAASDKLQVHADEITNGLITAAAIATGAIDADAIAADAVAEIADGVWDEDATGHQTGGTFGQAIGDPGADTTTIYQSVVTDAAGANIAADIAAIEAQTDDIGVAGAGLSAIPWNAAWDAEVQSEVTDGLNAYDPPTRAELTSDINSVLNILKGLVLVSGTIGATGNDDTHLHLDGLTYGNDEILNYYLVIFDNSASEYHVRAITDWVLATELATVATLPFTPEASVDTYWLLSAQTASAGSLTAAEVADAVWDEAQADHVAVGSFGITASEIADILVDTSTTLQGELDGIQADTEDLQAKLGTPSDLGTGATVAANLVDIEGMVDNLPAIETKIDTIDGIVDDILVDTGTTLQGELDGIQADTEDIQSRLPAALTAGGNIKADALAISGDTAAADNLEKEYDGTGYGKVLQRTTITNLSSQTVFDLTAGSADDNAYNGCIVVVEDQTTAAQKAVGVVLDYTGATKTITLLVDPAIFTMANGDIITIIADQSLKATVPTRTLDVDADSDLPWNADWDAEVQSEVADALAVYDPPTNAEMEARTLPSANYFDPSTDDVSVSNLTSAAVGDILKEAISNHEGAAASRSLLWAISKLVNAVISDGVNLTIRKTDDATTLFSQAITSDANAEPIIELDTN